ncbi:Hydantoinase/oxoprolinase [Rubripirellula tenax]|uniref:Hydantoinase/oxoprolinase n=1 Tax=Rubripirellula tenax TaxID=2528015 RepID=A0A5C6EJN9_9BACT|nr:hydantoinase/oxoprolinase family protein [Rubripirellula tenax]TWU47499.1 Hydantoinase/oxoprolinase [Rubripirellula tenax]
MPTRPVIGIDIGGANLKYCVTDGSVLSRPFEMWKRSGELAATLLADLIGLSSASSPPYAIAITMTGELADCFDDREAGVRFIVDAAVQAGRQVNRKMQGVAPAMRFYGVDGAFHPADKAGANFETIAAANWHALASWVAQAVVDRGTLIDIGSTTTDIIRLSRGRVATSAMTDHQRLVEQSLVYIGCRRTPVCGLVRQLSHGNVACSVMNEWFATIDDARILLGIEHEREDEIDTADGQPRTVDRSIGRMARMIGLDRQSVSIEQARDLAYQVIAAAKREIRQAFESIDDGQGVIVISGHGSDLFDVPAGRDVIDLRSRLNAEQSRCAPAWAVAQLMSRAIGADASGQQSQ